MGREYTENQQLEDKSRTKLKGCLAEWIINEQYEDYGLDFEVRLTTKTDRGRREATGTTFYIQIKASESLSGQSEVGISLDTDLIDEQFLKSNVPTVLVLYDESRDELYWQVIESYCWDRLDNDNPQWRNQKTVRVKMPRRSLNSSLEELENEVLSAERRIVLKHSTDLDIHEGVPKSAGTKELERIRNELYRQFQKKTLLQGEKYLEEEQKEKAIRLFSKIFESPVSDESTLYAGLKILSNEKFGEDLKSSAHKAHILSRATRLANIYDHEKLTELVEESKSIKPYLRSQLIGSRYENTEIEEKFTIVDVEDWIPGPQGMMVAALQQYDDGIPYDENALAIVQRDDYRPLSETGPTLRGCCREGEHKFPKRNLRIDSPPAFCEKCGLSSSVILEFGDHDPPFVCDVCDVIESFDNFTEGFMCESCRSKISE